MKGWGQGVVYVNGSGMGMEGRKERVGQTERCNGLSSIAGVVVMEWK